MGCWFVCFCLFFLYKVEAAGGSSFTHLLLLILNIYIYIICTAHIDRVAWPFVLLLLQKHGVEPEMGAHTCALKDGSAWSVCVFLCLFVWERERFLINMKLHRHFTAGSVLIVPVKHVRRRGKKREKILQQSPVRFPPRIHEKIQRSGRGSIHSLTHSFIHFLPLKPSFWGLSASQPTANQTSSHCTKKKEFCPFKTISSSSLPEVPPQQEAISSMVHWEAEILVIIPALIHQIPGADYRILECLTPTRPHVCAHVVIPRTCLSQGSRNGDNLPCPPHPPTSSAMVHLICNEDHFIPCPQVSVDNVLLCNSCPSCCSSSTWG